MPQVQLPVLPALFRDQTQHIQRLTHRVPSLLQSPADSSISLTASSEEFGLACFEFVTSSTSSCSSCDLEEEGAAWHRPAQLLRVQKVQQDGDGYPVMHREVLVGHHGSSNGSILAKPCLAVSRREHPPEATCFRTFWVGFPTSPSSSLCCEGKGTKFGHCPPPGLEGHLDSVSRMNFQRMSPGMVQGGEALRGAARLTPLGCPTAARPAGRLPGLQGQGSPLRRCWFPVDAECHLLSHRSLPAAPGVFWQDTPAGAATQRALALAVP